MSKNPLLSSGITNPRGGGYLGYEHTGRCRWKISKATLSWSQIPENDTLSWSKIFLNNTLSFVPSNKIVPYKETFVRNLSKNVEILPSKLFESYSQSANGLEQSFGDKMTNMDPVMEPIFTKMIPCPGVEILKMI